MFDDVTEMSVDQIRSMGHLKAALHYTTKFALKIEIALLTKCSVKVVVKNCPA